MAEAATNLQTIENIEKKIDSVTKYCRPYINKLLKDLSTINFENANIICDYIIAEQTEFDIKPTTKNGKIKALVYLSHSCNDKKPLKKLLNKIF